MGRSGLCPGALGARSRLWRHKKLEFAHKSAARTRGANCSGGATCEVAVVAQRWSGIDPQRNEPATLSTFGRSPPPTRQPQQTPHRPNSEHARKPEERVLSTIAWAPTPRPAAQRCPQGREASHRRPAARHVPTNIECRRGTSMAQARYIHCCPDNSSHYRTNWTS